MGTQNMKYDQSGDLTQLTLAAIEKHICKPKQDEAELPISTQHPFLTGYRLGKVFVDLPELAITDLESMREGTKTAASKTEAANPHLEIANELSFFRKLKRGMTNDWRMTSTHGNGEGIDKGSTAVPTRRAIEWQMSRLTHEQEMLETTVKQLIDQYVPNHYPHPLLRRCWGTIHEINQVRLVLLISLFKHSNETTDYSVDNRGYT
jgi:hypothetical protein